MLVATHGMNWESRGLEATSEFQAMKDAKVLLFCQLPLLEIDGLRLVQSQSTIRYLSRQGGLQGTNDAEIALVDMVCETIKDCRGPIAAYPFKSSKEEAKDDACAIINKFFPHFESMIQSLSGLFTTRVSTADLLLAELIEEFLHIVDASMFDHYIKCKRIHAAITGQENFKTYLSSTKRYPFPKGQDGKAYKQNVDLVLGR